jgi:hypothetical protein
MKTVKNNLQNKNNPLLATAQAAAGIVALYVLFNTFGSSFPKTPVMVGIGPTQQQAIPAKPAQSASLW